MPTTIAIELSQLTKKFKDITAVDDVSMKIYQGDVYGILGPNGAGKTTTISMMLGLIAPSHGTVQVLGQIVNPLHNSVLREVGALVGDRPVFFPYLTARQNVALMADLLKVPTERVTQTLETVGISQVADKEPGTYSTGMKQRLGLALALIHQPKILILDEPTNGMDPTGIQEIRGLIRTLAQQGTTVLLCSHLLHEVEQVCNRVAVFNKGHIVIEGVMQELKGRDPLVRIRTNKLSQTTEYLKTISTVKIVATDAEYLDVTGMDSDTLIELLVEHELTPREVIVNTNQLEEIFMRAIEEK